MPDVRIVVHGGVGFSEEFSAGCVAACREGKRLLDRGASALEAVIAAVVVMEDDPGYNAGTGSNIKLDGAVQMDAAVMSSDGRCGAVAGIQGVKNPILVAQKVMELTPHILLAGDGATRFARKCGFAEYDPATDAARKRLADAKAIIKQGKKRGHEWLVGNYPELFHGTVGAVARDADGNFASAVSTGGTAGNMPGRVGDSPVIGAGLFAGPAGAVGATGIGEEVIRKVLCKSVYDDIARDAQTEPACRKWVGAYPAEISMGLIAVSRESHAAVANKPMAHGIL